MNLVTGRSFFGTFVFEKCQKLGGFFLLVRGPDTQPLVPRHLRVYSELPLSLYLKI
jgi:hypothetical protein